MQFQKEDLKGTHYNWVDNSNKLILWEPSRRKFDPFNGNQILLLVNFYGTLSEKFTLQEAEKLEQKIMFELPDDAKSEIAVFNWLKRTEFSIL
jgi:hypothetical protein